MKALILAAGRFGDTMRAAIAEGREPRLDVFELARVLDADVIDFGDVDRSNLPAVRLAARSLGASAAVAALGYAARKSYDALLTTGEDIGLPYAALMKASTTPVAHTMIAHTLHPLKKRVFFQYARVMNRLDCVLVYSTSEKNHAVSQLHLPEHKVQQIYYHADEHFFAPDGRQTEPGLICGAGQLLRDYDCLIDAVEGLDVRVQIAAGSPWIDQPLKPRRALPSNISWGKLSRFDLRELYARSSIAVVPILENGYQTGIATILEMMAMGKCVIATRTRGQTDTIVDGETGIYVPPSDRGALRAAIEGALNDPEKVKRIGNAARKFVEQNAGLDRFVERVAKAVTDAHGERFARTG